ncbi:MAG TPA: hypothetical protein VFE42_19215 [Chloroflexota bacterium]|nr:hypothetical protein [Chloroflexota bacterium]HZS89607.1 hypothetical protein [Chloroflexota bacterium]
MTRLRLESDGTPAGTHIYTEDGQEIEGLQFITCEIQRAGQPPVTFAAAVLRVILASAEIRAQTGELGEVTADVARIVLAMGDGTATP